MFGHKQHIIGLIDPTHPGLGLFGVHDGKCFAGLIVAGERFYRVKCFASRDLAD